MCFKSLILRCAAFGLTAPRSAILPARGCPAAEPLKGRHPVPDLHRWVAGRQRRDLPAGSPHLAVAVLVALQLLLRPAGVRVIPDAASEFRFDGLKLGKG